MKKKPVLICLAVLVLAAVACGVTFAVKAAQPKNDVFTDDFFAGMTTANPMMVPSATQQKQETEKMMAYLKGIRLEPTEDLLPHYDESSDTLKVGGNWGYEIWYEDGSWVWLQAWDDMLKVMWPIGENEFRADRYYVSDKHGAPMTGFAETMFRFFYPDVSRPTSTP